MIAFGCAIRDGEAYRRYAEPGIRRVAEDDSAVLAFAAAGPAGRNANLILDEAARIEGLEALVLVAPTTEIVAPRFSEVVREALGDPLVGAVGSAGANGVRSIAWWEGELVAAAVAHRYEEHHGGEMPLWSWAPRLPPPAEVEVLDGQMLVLSAWAVQHLRFDEEFVLGYGFDVDYCLRLRESGRRLVVVDLPVVHHGSLKLVENPEIWVEAHIAFARKWGASVGPRVEPTDEDDAWKPRARLAEARREAARAVAFSRRMELDAKVAELERTLERRMRTRSWKLTEPLRRLNAMRRQAARAYRERK